MTHHVVAHAIAEYGDGRVIEIGKIHSMSHNLELPGLGPGWIYRIEVEKCECGDEECAV